MKVLIWFACILASVLVRYFFEYMGVAMNGIPRAFIDFAAFATALILCNKWDKHKKNK